jgi:hypothetical protein
MEIPPGYHITLTNFTSQHEDTSINTTETNTTNHGSELKKTDEYEPGSAPFGRSVNVRKSPVAGDGANSSTSTAKVVYTFQRQIEGEVDPNFTASNNSKTTRNATTEKPTESVAKILNFMQIYANYLTGNMHPIQQWRTVSTFAKCRRYKSEVHGRLARKCGCQLFGYGT